MWSNMEESMERLVRRRDIKEWKLDFKWNWERDREEILPHFTCPIYCGSPHLEDS